jgi:hypothetical protein
MAKKFPYLPVKHSKKRTKHHLVQIPPECKGGGTLLILCDRATTMKVWVQVKGVTRKFMDLLKGWLRHHEDD